MEQDPVADRLRDPLGELVLGRQRPALQALGDVGGQVLGGEGHQRRRRVGAAAAHRVGHQPAEARAAGPRPRSAARAVRPTRASRRGTAGSPSSPRAARRAPPRPRRRAAPAPRGCGRCEARAPPGSRSRRRRSPREGPRSRPRPGRRAARRARSRRCRPVRRRCAGAASGPRRGARAGRCRAARAALVGVGYWPVCGTRPPVGLWPKTPLKNAGMRIEPPMSVPRPNGATPAPTMAPSPPELRRRCASGRTGCWCARRRGCCAPSTCTARTCW